MRSIAGLLSTIRDRIYVKPEVSNRLADEDWQDSEWTYIPWSGEPSPAFPKQLSFATSYTAIPGNYSTELTHYNDIHAGSPFLYWLSEIGKNPDTLEDPRFLQWAVSEHVTPGAKAIVVDGDNFAVPTDSFGVEDVYVPVKIDRKGLKITLLGWSDAATSFIDDQCFCAGGDMVLLSVDDLEYTPY